MRACHNALIYRPYKETANVFLVTANISPSVLAVWELHALSPPSAGRYALGSNYPVRACAARGKVISRGWCPGGVHKKKIYTFFWNQNFISQNTHFQRSVLTQIGFSSNLIASGTA